MGDSEVVEDINKLCLVDSWMIIRFDNFGRFPKQLFSNIQFIEAFQLLLALDMESEIIRRLMRKHLTFRMKFDFLPN